MIVTISLGTDLDLNAMASMASQEACPSEGILAQRYCPPPNNRNCCHYRAPTAQNLDAVFRELLNNGPVRLVE